MIRLSGFADEIGPDLDLQIRTLQEAGLRHLELRSVWDTNVLDLSADQRREVKARLGEAGIGVSSIGSPIGKVRIDEPWEDHAARFRHCLEVAAFFEAPYIRLFSFYPPEGGRIEDHRDEVIRRLREMVAMAEGRPVRLLHENEAGIYGMTAEACLDIAEHVPGMGLIFDPANFVRDGVETLPAWRMLAEHVVYFHIKDMRAADRRVVLPGEGDGHIPEILEDAIRRRGFDGFISLEPHLTVAGEHSGFSGPEGFKDAVEAVKTILDRIGAPYDAPS